MRSLNRAMGLAAIAALALMLALAPRANAMTLAQPAAQADGLVIQAHGGGHGGGGGGHGGGHGGHGGGFHGFGGGFGGYIGPDFYDDGPDYYGPDYYAVPGYEVGAPYCHLVMTAYGPRRVCGVGHAHYRHYYHRHVHVHHHYHHHYHHHMHHHMHHHGY
ncbi:MAG: hypothetical protein P4M07_25055 [Xanthobacteraceae bacterium]|nr:hypothetical protein [Xanthobacteraceae bacterium]